MLGEFVGFGLGFGTGAALVALFPPAEGVAGLGITIAVAAVAGAIEGLTVGIAQWRVLRTVLARVTGRQWVGATVLGAVIAWIAGMMIGSNAGEVFADGGDPGVLMMVAAGASIGALAGVLLALPQWLVLRRAASSAALWIPAHALGWAVGIVISFVGVDLAGRATSMALSVGVIAASAVAMGAAAAAISGLALVRMVEFSTPPRIP